MSEESYTCILVDQPLERVNRITLNRVEKRNALSDQLRKEMFDALHKADTDHSISVTIIRGNDECFSAGYDLSEPKDTNENFPLPALVIAEDCLALVEIVSVPPVT